MKLLSYLFVCTLLISCNGNKIKQFALYTPTIVDKVEPFPTKNELLERVRVVIVTDDQTSVNIANFNQKQIASSSLENILQKIKTADILDRGVLKNIKEELILSELKNGTSVIGNKDADYVFLIKMDSLIFSSEYDDRSTAKMAYSAAKIGVMVGAAIATKGRGIYFDNSQNPISGKYYYNAAFTGSLSVIKMPTAESVAKIPLSGIIEDSESGELNGMNKAKDYDPIMMKNAIIIAIKNSVDKISSYIPAIGHIIARSDYKEDEPTLFKISFGSNDGIYPGDEVILERKIYETNPLTNEQELSINKIKLGTIIENNYGENFCWAQTTDKALASTVKIGEKIIFITKPIIEDEE
jgi:hypothetical protein